MNVSLEHPRLPDDILYEIFNREAALWIGSHASEAIDPELLAQLMALPWKIVLSESSSKLLAVALASLETQSDSLSSHRGFVYLIASDPATRPLPPRCLPIYFLNGREDAKDRAESSALTGMSAQRRRLNMLGRLQTSGVKRLVVLGLDPMKAIEELRSLWEADFRTLTTVVVEPNNQVEQEGEGPGTGKNTSFVRSTASDFAEDVVRRSLLLLPDANLVVRMKEPSGEIKDFDISEAELPEHPILDQYELVKSRYLHLLTPNDLTIDDIEDFFSQGHKNWKPYAAGLPWETNDSARKKVIRSLASLSRDEAEGNQIHYIVSEPGAGGTTCARTIAFAAASAGFPTLIAREHVIDPSATELVSFLNRVLFGPRQGADEARPQTPTVPWLIIFDRTQWDGQEQKIVSFLNEVKRSGRLVVIVKVLDDQLPEDLPTGSFIAHLSHQLELKDVTKLGAHLNKYLKPFNRGKKDTEWEQFWENHRPDMEVSVAAFWITLEFWLKGLIELGESVQTWLLRHFKECEMAPDIRRMVLELAALTIERRSIPELLLPVPSANQPLSVILEELRRAFPALALVRQNTPTGRQWALAHDVLGRYLINACYYDRALMRELGFHEFQSPVELRLHLIHTLTMRTEIGSTLFLPFAVQFAVKTLKLDESGNAEFYPYWRNVLSILEGFPSAVRKASRTFNHHVAISRRRVAKSDFFQRSDQERREQLLKAISEIEFALNNLDETREDESNLNLYNSLALACQDMAEFELLAGSNEDLVNAYRAKATTAIYSALRENPSNSYALETAAKNLLQQAKLDQSSRVSCAAESLGYIFQATNLERSDGRQFQLGKLANQAILLLRESDSEATVRSLMASGNPMGHLAAAWLRLTQDHDQLTTAAPSSFPTKNVAEALQILSEAPRHWLVARLQYDLVCLLTPNSFGGQLDLLDELNATPNFLLTLQQRLERAILLHLLGRHQDANAAFKRLRQDTYNRQSEIVSVPDRLRWFVNPDGVNRVLCHARVVDNFAYRPLAKVTEIGSVPVPFIAQDFGADSMPPNMTFRCHITFGPMGPFIKPAPTQR